MIRTCSSSHRKIHRLDTFRPNSSLANYPQSNRTYRQLSRRQPHSTTPLPRFFRIRRVPRIPLVKLRRRAERKFLVPNSSLSLSRQSEFRLGDSAASKRCCLFVFKELRVTDMYLPYPPHIVSRAGYACNPVSLCIILSLRLC